MDILKRIFDILASGIALIVLFPIFAAIGIFIKLDSKGSVFFVQERAGKDGKIFKAYKLRTMIQGADKKTEGIFINRDNLYISRIGKFLRRSGIDELPQLINVLKGDMSLVGPRPTLKYQVENYNDIQKQRLLIKPGITGWALINGRNKLTWPERIKLDIWYIENRSFWLDLKILFRTIIVVVNGEGMYAGRERDNIMIINKKEKNI
jgi:lipopolysaccharide/colanic/teichoic acid biosynthesis glycosyltransferase